MKTVAISLNESRIRQIEFCGFALLILLVNIPLFWGAPATQLAFTTGSVAAGQWWRVFTHAFMHVSWYHLALDAGAFFILLRGLLETRWHKRLFYVAASCIGSLIFSLLSPDIARLGLCGLSGTAHGLMAVSGLEMAMSSDRSMRRIGVISFLIVAIKGMIEVSTGSVMFAFLHIGYVGTPVTLCHAGGILGGIASFVLLRKRSRKH